MMNPVAEAALEVLVAGTEFPGLRRALFAAVAGRHLKAGTAALQVGVAEGEGRLPLEVLLERLPTRPLATVATINKGRTGIKDSLPGPYPLVVTAEERGSSDHFDFEGPGVMIPMVSSTGHGDASLKRVHFQDGQYAVGSILAVVQPRDPEQLSARYLHAYLSSFKDELLVSRMVGTANVSLTVAKIGDVPVPLLPIDAQRKVDELMALCDRLEARQQDAEAAHARLVQALLDSLTQARDSEEFQVCWQRLATTFAEAFVSEASVDALTQTLRKMAFQGAMSRHGAADWGNVRVVDAVQFLNGYAFKSEWFVPHGIRLVRNVNIAHGTIDWREVAYIAAERSDEFASFALKEGDVLLSLDRPLISTGLKVAVVRAADLPCLLLQRVARLTPNGDQLRAAYLLHWLRSPLFIDGIDPGRSNGVPHISTKQVGNMTIPLPTLEEQDRIVAKLDELLAICDQLKALIAAARAKHAQLAEALVAQAIAA